MQNSYVLCIFKVLPPCLIHLFSNKNQTNKKLDRSLCLSVVLAFCPTGFFSFTFDCANSISLFQRKPLCFVFQDKSSCCSGMPLIMSIIHMNSLLQFESDSEPTSINTKYYERNLFFFILLLLEL